MSKSSKNNIETYNRRKKIALRFVLISLVFFVFSSIVAFIITEANKTPIADFAPEEIPLNTSDDGALLYGDSSAPVVMDLYEDPMCIACTYFMNINDEDIDALVNNGTLFLKWHPMTFLDSQSLGTQYSTRAVNALVVVQNDEPEKMFDYLSVLYDNAPAEGTAGLTDEELVELAISANIDQSTYEKFEDRPFQKWIVASEDLSSKNNISQVPTIIINGERYTDDWSVPGALKEYIESLR